MQLVIEHVSQGSELRIGFERLTSVDIVSSSKRGPSNAVSWQTYLPGIMPDNFQQAT
jgi:hypothetical protein